MVLSVGDVGYTAESLVGLSESRQALLQHVTALSLSLSDGALDELIAPLLSVERANRLHLLAEAEERVSEEGFDEGVLEARYAADPAYELTVRHLIVLSDRREDAPVRDSARVKAERALARIQAGESFPEVAAEVSEEPGAEGRQGLLEPGREGAWVDEFWSAASALEVGGISEVVETQYGFHVLHLDGRDTVPFADARSSLVLRIARELGLDDVTTAEATRPSDVAFAEDVRTTTAEGAVLASWPGGEVRWDDLLDRAAAEGGVTWDGLLAGDPEVRSRMLDLELAEAAALARAEALGLRVDAGWMEERTRDLLWPLESAAQLLGIPTGVPQDRIVDISLAALGRSGQNADLARDDLRRWRGILDFRWRYSRTWSETDPPETP